MEWPTLKTLLKGWGFGKKFRGIIDQLYLENTSVVILNDGMMEQIALGRGTRQGCPLSPVVLPGY